MKYLAKQRSKRISINGELNPENIKLWKQYKRAKQIAGKSEKTIYNYECDIMQFFKFLNIECFDALLTDINEEEIEAYIGYCMEHGNNEKRIRRRISSISSLLSFLKKKRKITDNWCEMIERPGTGEEVQKRTFLTEEQLSKLKEKLSEQDNLQLEVYINLGLATMARSNEISQFRWDNIDLDNRWIHGITAKGGVSRDFRFSEEVQHLLIEWKDYLSQNNIDYPYIFFTRYGGKYNQVNSNVLSSWVKKAFRLIGIEGGYNHDLRHSMSNLLKDRGVPITTVSKLLGHSGVDVTINHYTIENKNKLAEEYDKFM
ncbi:tyrosine-type recombinase/integrase [Clostridioides difficile]|uniref:tyrosine-type recombinase/integrase n=2 Tax=Clostridioides difficile TaxID=1496 RepID=UPI001F2C44AF|nr:site-specific integrase [Clostridioides difficile]MCG3607551.1 tyrosine-type recombinase/integrase [Clostridioides difficile]MCG7687331.1 tyrosine-type recombinase/integrase [Clostridioides difficile]MCI2307630.1 tyrosine-type recombinase/integrase [Clostridioides difficile]MCM3859978.1 tyrosine-type recombinase/integrase [Clostridioides difficile]MCO5863868.1 tyrosine-type recombinase/integrase [Clostridioides difficile]